MSKFKAMLAKLIMIKYLGVKGTEIINIDGKYYLYRRKNLNYLGDFSIFIAGIHCLKIFGLKIPILVTDRWFDDITENNDGMKEFIIRHEIGHYELKHFNNELDFMTTSEKIQLELEADAYAANSVGNNIAFSALTELEKYIDVKFNTFDESILVRKESLRRKIETA